jgi:ornithine cyclodeaminase/alanine dehydrogenase
MTICGAGAQARFHLRAFQNLFPLRRVFVYSRDEKKRRAFTTEMSQELGITVEPVADLTAARESDIVVTCTTARKSFLPSDVIADGTFVGAVGADSPHKQELTPELMARGRVVADLVEQSAKVGELHHAIEARVMTADAIHAELGQIVAGHKPGRTSPDEIFIFDSTGTALQDVAAAARAYEKANASGHGTMFNFSAANLS